ncbi:MAG: hypothetical protein ACLQBX_10805, partial [Candidatus Limnocylindrales bacterium]
MSPRLSAATGIASTDLIGRSDILQARAANAGGLAAKASGQAAGRRWPKAGLLEDAEGREPGERPATIHA